MADVVRRTMEEMVPELEDLERRGYFNRDEIKQIMSRRRDFEYSLRRRAAIKTDFLRYVQYETSLEQLRKLRKKQRSIEGAATLADFCIIRRIHYIFERATRKFRGDLRLWSRWLRFCQTTGSSQRMSRVLTHALQLHQNCPALWSYAAAWEFEHNSNTVAARSLMQRGLRLCKWSEGLWHEYFRLELLYAARLAARRKVLGIGLQNEEKNEEIETKDTYNEVILKGSVAKVVYTNAIATIPKSLTFRAFFLEILDSVDLPDKQELYNFIINDILETFGNDSKALELCALRKLRSKYEVGGEMLTTEAVHDLLAPFESSNQNDNKSMQNGMISILEYMIKLSISKEDSITEVLMKRYRDLVLSIDQPSMHGDVVASKLGQRLGLGVRSAPISTISPASLRQKLCMEALEMNSIPKMKSLLSCLASGHDTANISLWLCALRLALSYGLELDEMAKLFVKCQEIDGKGSFIGGKGIPAACIFRAIWNQSGADEARKFYMRLLPLPLPGSEFIHAILDCEIANIHSIPKIKTKSLEGGTTLSAINRIRKCFEAGINGFGELDDELWFRYLHFEQEYGEGKAAASVHWRAVKRLRSPDSFVARVQMVQSGLH